MMSKLFWLIFAAAFIVAAAPASAEKPAYCSGVGTERLPECGWTDGKGAATVQQPRDERRKLTEAEVQEMARIFANCMNTDKTREQCAKQAGIPLSALR